MLLTTCSSATSDLLVSLADVKEAMNLTDEAYDQTLTRMIRRASSRIETYCGRPLLSQVYQAALPSYGSPILQLPRYPVRSVLRVFDGTDTGTGTELSSTDYRVKAEVGQLYRDQGFAWTYVMDHDVAPYPEPGKEYTRWMVEFSAGYVPAGGKDSGSTGDGTTSTSCTVPMDLQEAAISLTRNMWMGRTRDSSVTSKRVGELAVTYGDQSGGIVSTEIAELLAPYRSLA